MPRRETLASLIWFPYAKGSGGGSVGRAVASDTRDLRFESQAKFYLPILHLNRKDENKEKEARNGPSF